MHTFTLTQVAYGTSRIQPWKWGAIVEEVGPEPFGYGEHDLPGDVCEQGLL